MAFLMLRFFLGHPVENVTSFNSLKAEWVVVSDQQEWLNYVDTIEIVEVKLLPKNIFSDKVS